jgi:GH25 family lysozyme M1 (1,4-beta-N-acetylmuramidase)
MQKIIDVSKWQGLIDYDKVAKSGKVDGVILRSSIGNTTDEKFYEYADGFHKAGIPVIGIYHFSHAIDPSAASKEAALAVSNAEKAGLPKNTLIFLDFEYESLDNLKNCCLGIKADEIKSKIDEIAKKFCFMVEAGGYKAGIYFNPDFYKNWFNTKTISKYTKWLAEWKSSKSLECDIWQYGTINVPGINGSVDANECYITDLQAYAKPKKSNEEVANDVIKGLYGVGEERKKKLKEDGYDYKTIQDIVNKKLETPAKDAKPKKSNEEVANDVIKGLYGVGEERKKRLSAEGYDYKTIQSIVNKKTNNTFNKITPANKRDTSLSGSYKVTAAALNIRYAPGILTNNNVIKVIKKDTIVQNYGYYTEINGIKWLYIQVGNTVGHVDSRYLSKN